MEPDISTYWSAEKVAESGMADTFTGSLDEAIEQLDGILREAVKIRMVADVPIGAFLSGGYDSSTVVAMMQAQSTRPVKTFTIGYSESGYNEAEDAKAVAKHLGTEHTELYVTPRDAMDVIPKLPTLYDEPFSDSSQIPTFLISQLARHYVTVALSGDGGDELFGGYNRHFWVLNIWKKIGRIYPLLRDLASRGLQTISPLKWDLIFYKLNDLLPLKRKFSRMGDKIYKFSEILPLKTPEMMYQVLCSHWKKPEDIVVSGRELLTNITNSAELAYFLDFTHRIMYLDLITYLPDDILTKLDRASMGVSLEARVPILDHRVVEFAWKLPLDMKIRNGKGKWILRQVLNKYVPEKLVERPKMGFGIPIDAWLRGPLRDWAEAFLEESRLRQEGYFNPQPIRQKWAEHLSGKRNWTYHLWDVLMFQGWLENHSSG
jgi:asparagine synthase (glutamine-hydrolysing)